MKKGMKNPAKYVRVRVCKLIRNSCRVSQRNFTGGSAAVNLNPFAGSEKKRGPSPTPTLELCLISFCRWRYFGVPLATVARGRIQSL